MVSRIKLENKLIVDLIPSEDATIQAEPGEEIQGKKIATIDLQQIVCLCLNSWIGIFEKLSTVDNALNGEDSANTNQHSILESI